MSEFITVGQHPKPQPTVCVKGGVVPVSARLVAISLAIQLADIIVNGLLAKRGFFQIGAGPMAQWLGLSQFTFWSIWKTSVFVILITATLTNRRRMIVFLNFCFGWLLIWGVLIFWMSVS
jgi:hypothetical protein